MNFLNLKNECDDNLMSWITTSINISGTFSINICETLNIWIVTFEMGKMLFKENFYYPFSVFNLWWLDIWRLCLTFPRTSLQNEWYMRSALEFNLTYILLCAKYICLHFTFSLLI